MARRRHLIGLDIGTTSARALLVAEAASGSGHVGRRAEVIAQASEAYGMAVPAPGWAEQDPDDWWRGACEATRRVLASSGVSPSDVVAIGLSGQMHSLVALDKYGRPLRPAILWCDQRTFAECDEITHLIGGRAALALHTGNRALTGFTAPKLLWLRRHEPAIYGEMRLALVGKDYVRYRLTDEAATDASEASGTLLFDVAARRWSDEVLGRLDIDRALLPRVHEGPEVTGSLTQRAAQAMGLVAGTPVVAGGGDQAAFAVGAKVIAPGRTSVVLGTSGVVLSALESPAADPEARLHMFCHAVPGRWFQMGVTLAAGGSLRWLRDALGLGADERSYPPLLDEAAAVSPGSDGLLFAPYLTGERTPHNDPDVRGGFIGLGLLHGRGHLVRAVLEGVAMSLRDVLGLMDEVAAATGAPARDARRAPILVGGGGARGPLWVQIVADVLGRPVTRLAVDEGPAMGAALLAGVGAAVFEGCEQVAAASAELGPTVEPGAAAARYDELYARWRKLYPVLRDLAQSTRSE
jgi:xylulokinase